ncbi:MAG: hypothetical protein AAB410_05220, partial [Patescibacteria group bacterium]
NRISNGVKNNKILIIIVFIIAILDLLFLLSKNKTVSNPQNSRNPVASPESRTALEAKTNEEGPVKVKVTPIDVSQNSKLWKFNVVLDTHSVELDYDLTKAVSLFDEQGKEYKPVSWEGPGPGGHHIDGNLTFNTITPVPKEIEIRIVNVGDVAIRSLVWQLK